MTINLHILFSFKSYFVLRSAPLEKETATHSSVLASEIPWTDEPAGYSPWGQSQTQVSDFAMILLLS